MTTTSEHEHEQTTNPVWVDSGVILTGGIVEWNGTLYHNSELQTQVGEMVQITPKENKIHIQVSTGLSVNGDAILLTTTLEKTINMVTRLGQEKNSICQIVGEPGVGKTLTAHYLAYFFDGHYFRCNSQLKTEKDILVSLLEALDPKEAKTTGSPRVLMGRLLKQCSGKLLLIDEANFLSWKQLEIFRDLADVARARIVLLGTPLLKDTLNDARNKVYLKQLKSRIGRKKITLSALEDVELKKYILLPLGFAEAELTDVVLQALRKYSDGGDWRMIEEVALTCIGIQKNGKKKGKNFPLSPNMIKEAVKQIAS